MPTPVKSILATLIVIAGCTATSAQDYTVGPLKVEQPWARATPAGARTAAGYMTIVNTGTDTDRLVGGSLADAGRVEIHEMKMEGNLMTMRPVPGGLELKPGQTVALKPDGYHVMFMDLRAPLKQGEKVKGQLRFEKSGTVDVEYTVESVGAQSGPAPHH